MEGDIRVKHLRLLAYQIVVPRLGQQSHDLPPPREWKGFGKQIFNI